MHSRKTDNSPHIFAVADHAYQMMMHNRRNQCIVISGESGAGKTESANLLVQQLTQLGKAPNRTLEDRILQVNPLMEAFGNAKTIINDNSSRFGKYLEMFFTATSGTVVGAKITEYLLEKSRVINQAPGEQNFHIFYYIHDGLIASDREAEYHLKPNTAYKYIGEYTRASTNVASMSVNRVRFKAIEHCFESIGFKPEEVKSVYGVLAAILHAGNIEFVSKESEYGGDACKVKDTSLITIVSELLGLDFTDVLESLTTTGMVAKGEVIIRENSSREAQNARDAMAKALYGRLFSWIVNRVSSLLKPGRVDHSHDECYTTGLLDIFGFENLKTNSFEQLCINIANEQIQYYFNQHIFAWELEEYRNEGVDAAEVTYIDNRPILDMFLSKPVGLLALLDEESHFPRATDTTLVEKLNQNVSSPIYSRSKSNGSTFCIDHFAGKIEYDAEGFLEKNRDRLPMEIMNIMRMSENKVVKHLFQTPLTRTGNLQNSGSMNSINSSRAGSPMSAGGRGGSTGTVSVTSYNSRGSGTMGGSKHASGSASMTRMQQTVATYFRYSLMDLLNKMVSGTPHFVRCIKPNDQKEPGNLVSDRVTTQLRYTGVLETTRIRRQGYSHRITFSDFIKRYHVLGFRHDEEVSVSDETCQRLLENIKLKDWALGKSKVFLKYYHVEYLAQAYEAMCQKIVRVQAYVRMWLARSRFYQLKWKRDKASIIIQKHMRGFIHRRKFTAVNRRRHQAATQIQKVVKGHYTRKKTRPIIAKRRKAAITIQSNIRGYLARKHVSRLRTIKEEEELKEKQAASASTIQRIYRLYRMKRQTAEIREKEMTYRRGKSATKIQAFYRMWRQRVVYRRLVKERERHKHDVQVIGKQISQKNHKMVKLQDDANHTASPSPPATPPASAAKRVAMADTAASAFKESPKRRAGNSSQDSPSKKVWTRVSSQAVGEARVEQMKKMYDIKKVIPDREADYYDQTGKLDSHSAHTPSSNINTCDNHHGYFRLQGVCLASRANQSDIAIFTFKGSLVSTRHFL
ncbi:myosin IIIA [Elysia marginata]|uniref:non-specific serine/threonine protein kinase n=1 Tax=Elysia marginata TaxID=1093978 RepID=A0AAV4G5E0_9GAST|nr:myosin IIIA [Elysia marginata]